ncbi:hypothetical protein [Nonomuraea dietziae]|uniref:hypothetical protein n=1 Tax=Nonomuraea dietziae TaxID=65515 RepID=UPI0031D97A61
MRERGTWRAAWRAAARPGRGGFVLVTPALLGGPTPLQAGCGRTRAGSVSALFGPLAIGPWRHWSAVGRARLLIAVASLCCSRRHRPYPGAQPPPRRPHADAVSVPERRLCLNHRTVASSDAVSVSATATVASSDAVSVADAGLFLGRRTPVRCRLRLQFGLGSRVWNG